MSLASKITNSTLIPRIKGFVNGMGFGVIAPGLAVIALIMILNGEMTSGSGMASAIGGFLLILVALAAVLFILTGSGVAATLSILGLPWFITFPVIYFGLWGTLGAWKFYKD